MDRNTIYRKPLHEQDLTALAILCANVARNTSADRNQSDTAHTLRVEWVRLHFVRSLRAETELSGDKAKAENSLKKRMAEFFSGCP